MKHSKHKTPMAVAQRSAKAGNSSAALHPRGPDGRFIAKKKTV